MLDIDELNRKCLVGDYTTFKSSEANNDQTKYEKLEMKIEQILEDNKKLNIAVSSLSSTNNALEKEILELKGKMNSLEKQTSISEITATTQWKENYTSLAKDEFNYPHVSDKINVLEEDIAKVDGKLQSMISQANTLLINDATHLERIFNLESQVSEINGKISNLENADLYLQEAHRVLTERTCLIEKYSNYIDEKVKLASNQPRTAIIDNSSERFEELLKRIINLEELNKHYNYESITNKGTEDVISKKKKADDKVNLYDNYNDILKRILKVEKLLGQQAQSISDYSELFSDKYSRLLRLKTDKTKETEIKSIITEKWKMEKEESSFTSRISDISNLNLENNKCGSECKIFDFIEILVGMNRSLNHMLDDYVASQLLLKSLKSQQRTLQDQMLDQKRYLDSHNVEISRLNEKVEIDHVREVSK